MSIKIKRYNVILKLAVALAILGCFFIANGRTVKAATVKGELQDNGNIDVTVSDLAAGVSVAIYLSDGTNNRELLTNITSNSSISAAAILQKAAEYDLSNATGIVVKYALSSASSTYNNLPKTSGSENVVTAPIYRATIGAVATDIAVTVHADSSTPDKAKDATGGNSGKVVYCYQGGKVVYTGTPVAGKRLPGWEKTVGGGTPTSPELIGDGWVGNSYTVAIGTDDVSVKAYDAVDAITKVGYDVSNKFLPAGVTDVSVTTDLKINDKAYSEYNYKWVQVEPPTVVPSGTVDVAISADGKLTVVSKTTTVPDEVTINIAMPHATNAGLDYPATITIPVYNGFDTAKTISIDGPAKCGLASTAGPYSVVSSSAGKATGNVDIEDYLWTIKPTDGGLKFLKADGSVGDIESRLATPSVKATAALGSQYTIKVEATDYFGVTKKASMEVTIVKPSITLTLDFDEDDGITNGYYMSGVVRDNPAGSLSSPTLYKINLSGDKASPTKDSATFDSYAKVWEAIIRGGTQQSDGTVSRITSNVVASVTAGNNNAGVSTVVSKFNVYPSPEDSSYNESSRTLNIMLPAPLNLGTVLKDGTEIDYDDLVEYDYVTGYELDVSRDGTSLSSTTNKTANTSGTTKSVPFSSSSLEKIVTDNKSKFSGDQDSINLTLKFYGENDFDDDKEIIKRPNGSTMTWTKNVPVYKVSIVGDSGLSSTTAYTYGLEGQEVSLTASVKSGYKITGWSDSTSYSSSVRKVTVSSDTSKNKYTVNTANSSSTSTSSSSTSKTSSGTGSDYDDVPKTSESNAPIWLIIFMVFAVIGSGYALYMQLRPVGAQDDSYDEEDEE